MSPTMISEYRTKLISKEILQKKLEELIIFWWNRSYPRDFRLDLDLSEWRKRAVREFPGNSHEKITEVCYRPVIK